MFCRALIAAVLISAAAPGVQIPVAMVSSVTSSNAKVGDGFEFRTTQVAQSDGTTIPTGSIGHGIVTAVSAAAGTHRGTLTLEPQYIELGSGAHLAVAPATKGATSFAARRHVFPFPIPFPGVIVIGGVDNPGANVTIGPGTIFNVVIASPQQ